MIGEVRFHRGRDAKRFMDAAEIVIGEVNSVGSPEVFTLFREGVREPREAAHGHANREVLALHVAGANLRGIGVTHDWDSLRMRDVGGAVPALAVGIGGVHLDALREVATITERRSNC